MDQPHVRRYGLTKREPDDITGHQVGHVDIDECPVPAHDRAVVDLGLQRHGCLFGAVFVDKAQSHAGGQDHPDDHRVGAIAQEIRRGRGDDQQDQHSILELTGKHRPCADMMDANCVRPQRCQTLGLRTR